MRAIMIVAALAFASAAPAAHAQAISKNQIDRLKAQCKGPDGKDATNAACKGAGPAAAASEIYKLDAKGQCRDGNGKAVKADKCKVS